MIKFPRHHAGFFSCCSLRLHAIVDFVNSHKTLPDVVDSSEYYQMYSKDNTDVTFDYFKHYDTCHVSILHPILYSESYQFTPYSQLQHNAITPLIEKYFSPSDRVNETVKTLEEKYNIDYENTVAIYYRGTDKYFETQLASFDDFYRQIVNTITTYPKIRLLIQTDSMPFLEYIKDKNLNILVIDENRTSSTNTGIHHAQSTQTNHEDMFQFLSTVLIISKCKHIICSSGNCSIWMILYRGHVQNIQQYLNGTWY